MSDSDDVVDNLLDDPETINQLTKWGPSGGHKISLNRRSIANVSLRVPRIQDVTTVFRNVLPETTLTTPGTGTAAPVVPGTSSMASTSAPTLVATARSASGGRGERNKRIIQERTRSLALEQPTGLRLIQKDLEEFQSSRSRLQDNSLEDESPNGKNFEDDDDENSDAKPPEVDKEDGPRDLRSIADLFWPNREEGASPVRGKING